MFGFDALAAFTHHCETAFDRVRKGEVPASPSLVSAVLAAQDHMRARLRNRLSSTAPVRRCWPTCRPLSTAARRLRSPRRPSLA